MMAEEKERLLVVEDDEDLLMITARQLERAGYEVLCAKDGESASKLLTTERIDLMLLDVMLPDCDGHDLCKRIREDFRGPILFMSCLGDSANIVDAFREGGNDYLVKPVNPVELVERVRENLRECKEMQEAEGRLWFRQFMVDRKTRSVYRVENGHACEKLDLSPTEYKILAVFIKKPDELFLYRQLYRQIWEQDDLDDIRTLMVHVSNLRKKIDYQHKEIIRSVRGAGYIFSDL